MLNKVVLPALLAWTVLAAPYPQVKDQYQLQGQDQVEVIPQLVVNVTGTINGSINGSFVVDDPSFMATNTTTSMMASPTLPVFISSVSDAMTTTSDITDTMSTFTLMPTSMMTTTTIDVSTTSATSTTPASSTTTMISPSSSPIALVSTSTASSSSSSASISSSSSSSASPSATLSPIRVYLTSRDLKKNALTQANSIAWNSSSSSGAVVKFNNKSYQSVQGFGASMTESSAFLISQLPNSTQTDVMTKLFDPKNGIGLNFLRQPIGGSDLALPYHFYTYSNTKPATTGAKSLLSAFSVQVDSNYVIPLLQQALSINPDISILGTPWSPPSWMRSGNSVNGTAGGSLQSQYYDDYAQYFIDYANQYAAAGIPIWAVTAQNEPLYAPYGYPGMSFSANEASNFIASNLIPAIQSANLTNPLKVLVYDHNWDHPEYPVQVLQDSNVTKATFQNANSTIAGVAWHCYADDPTGAQNMLQQTFPGVGQYLTECSGGTWEGSTTDAFETWIGTAISTMQNYGSALVRWGMALDSNGQPNLSTGAACSTCRGVIGIPDITTASSVAPQDVQYNTDYYVLGHFSKFVQKGAVRIGTSDSGSSVSHVEFRNPDGSIAMVIYNGNSNSETFTLQYNGSLSVVTIPAYTAATLTWDT